MHYMQILASLFCFVLVPILTTPISITKERLVNIGITAIVTFQKFYFFSHDLSDMCHLLLIHLYLFIFTYRTAVEK